MEADRHSPGILKKLQPALGRIGKYKYALIVLLAGVFLMLLPSRQERTTAAEPSAGASASEISEMQDALAKLLSKIDGAGRVEVLLSLEYGAESFYQSDEKISASGDTESREQTIVLYQPDSAQRLPAVRRTRYPVYRGAVVVCEGAGSPSVELAIVQAVSRLTGLGSDKISVIKMKRS